MRDSFDNQETLRTRFFLNKNMWWNQALLSALFMTQASTDNVFETSIDDFRISGAKV